MSMYVRTYVSTQINPLWHVNPAVKQLPRAEGILLYHEHSPQVARRFPCAQPAWRWMLERPLPP